MATSRCRCRAIIDRDEFFRENRRAERTKRKTERYSDAVGKIDALDTSAGRPSFAVFYQYLTTSCRLHHPLTRSIQLRAFCMPRLTVPEGGGSLATQKDDRLAGPEPEIYSEYDSTKVPRYFSPKQSPSIVLRNCFCSSKNL